MISVGIDISKRKSTAAILNVQGEVICSPFEFRHMLKVIRKMK